MNTISTRTIFAALAATIAATAMVTPAAAQGYRYGNDRQDHGRYEQDRYDQSRYDQGRYDQGRYNQESRGNHGDDRRVHQSINQRQQRLDWRIDRGLRDGTLSHREARRLREEFRQIAYLEMRYREGGLSAWERADLEGRFDRLEYQVRRERRDNDYGSGYYR